MSSKTLWNLMVTVFLAAGIAGGWAGYRHLDKNPGPVEGRPPVFSSINLEIRTAHGRSHLFSAEVAITPEQQEYGLMFREALAPDAAMLFVYDPPQMVSFWMKNTRLPLDMLFLRADGEIVKIIPRAEPYDLTPKNSDQPVGGVVEINGGEAEQLGIAVGDRVIYDLSP